MDPMEWRRKVFSHFSGVMTSPEASLIKYLFILETSSGVQVLVGDLAALVALEAEGEALLEEDMKSCEKNFNCTKNLLLDIFLYS